MRVRTERRAAEENSSMVATPASKTAAKSLADDFAKRTTGPAFKCGTRADIVDGLKVRVDSPDKIFQGNTGLCPSATVLYAIALDKPEDYVKAVASLYETGTATLGKWNLKPCADLKNYVLKATDTVPAVDWIPMASMRDSENWFIDFQATDDDGGAWGDEVVKYLKKAGYTTVVEGEWNYFFAKNQAHLDRASELYSSKEHNVLLLIDADILTDADDAYSLEPNHWVVLASGISYTVGAGGEKIVKLTVFSWGAKQDISMKFDYFIRHYYGFVACKF
jgi:hypothetical protein